MLAKLSQRENKQGAEQSHGKVTLLGLKTCYVALSAINMQMFSFKS